ncbi:MAG: hypothetical protein ACM37W_03155 [Actinomycetota bacterium]
MRRDFQLVKSVSSKETAQKAPVRETGKLLFTGEERHNARAFAKPLASFLWASGTQPSDRPKFRVRIAS